MRPPKRPTITVRTADEVSRQSRTASDPVQVIVFTVGVIVSLVMLTVVIAATRGI